MEWLRLAVRLQTICSRDVWSDNDTNFLHLHPRGRCRIYSTLDYSGVFTDPPKHESARSEHNLVEQLMVGGIQQRSIKQRLPTGFTIPIPSLA